MTHWIIVTVSWFLTELLICFSCPEKQHLVTLLPEFVSASLLHPNCFCLTLLALNSRIIRY